MDDVKHLMKFNYLKYASYVILDRAIPNVLDGLKPVQRRILHTLFRMHDGKMHKVANVAGQTMAFHPHGDAAITEALINIVNKGFLLDFQGNFGNIYTGDPAAASRYIETRLSPLARETMFNPELTEMLPSYDGRNLEPVCLPAKIPVLLMQGADGIAVGMATHILPHNFVELLEAEIAILEERAYTLLPDFLTGGIMDASGYDKGKGKVKLRTKITIKDPKTIVIDEICHGTTTESLIKSIDEAAKKGKIKIDGIHDYTSDKVEIEIKLPRGQYAEEIIDALYAYTECEVSLSSQIIVIKDNLPWETDVHAILELHAEKLQEYLRLELEIEQKKLLNKIFEKTLEQIFIENRMYKKIEEVGDYDEIHQVIAKSIEPFHMRLNRIPEYEDREKLLNIPIRRISRFDIGKNEGDIVLLEKSLDKVEKDLKQIKRYTIKYLKHLQEKYAKDYPRKTRIQEIERIDMRAIETRLIKVGFDPKSGFIGTKVTNEEAQTFECTNFDKVLIMFKDGSYIVTNIPEKQYISKAGTKIAYVGPADKKTILNVAYKDPKSHLGYAKRFIIDKFILDKSYRYFEEGMELAFLTTSSGMQLELLFIPKMNQRTRTATFHFDQVLVKGVAAKGIRMASKPLTKILLPKDAPAAAKQTEFDLK